MTCSIMAESTLSCIKNSCATFGPTVSSPDRADKVLHQIESCHGGSLNDSRYVTRMRGEGEIAKQINDLVKLAKLKYFKGKTIPKLNCSLHEQYKEG